MGVARGHLVLSKAERAELAALAGRRTTAQALALPARIVLACADGATNKEAAVQLDVCEDTVGKWRRRYIEQRLDGLRDAPRPGPPRSIDDARIEALIVQTLESLPPDATHWSSRSMAKASGISVTTVQRIWRAFSLQPERSETFKLSTDPLFVEKIRDIVGLYLDPPDHAVVLCNLGRLNSSVASLQRAISLGLHDFAVMSRLGIVYRQLGQLVNAEQVLRAVVDAVPLDANANSNLAVVLAQSGQFDESRHYHGRAVELAPGDVPIMTNRAYARLTAGG